MAEVINLHAVRKAKARAGAAAEAATNRAAFGRTKAQKQAEAAERVRHERALDEVKLTD